MSTLLYAPEELKRPLKVYRAYGKDCGQGYIGPPYTFVCPVGTYQTRDEVDHFFFGKRYDETRPWNEMSHEDWRNGQLDTPGGNVSQFAPRLSRHFDIILLY